jgi:streptogramin lyase
VVLALVCTASADAAARRPAEVVCSGFLEPYVYGVDPLTGAMRTISSGGSLVAPGGLAVAPDGDILVVDSGADALVRIDAVSGVQSVVSQGGLLDGAVAVAIERSGQILVGGTWTGLARVDPGTGAQALLAPSSETFRPSCLVVEASGTIVASDDGIDGFGGLHRVDPVTGASSLFSTVSDTGMCVAIESSGSLLVSSLVAREVVRVDPGTGAGHLLSAGGLLVLPDGIAVTDTGSVVVANQTSLVRIDPSSGAQSLIWSGTTRLHMIAFSPQLLSTVPRVPAVSTWGAICLALLVAGLGVGIIQRRIH